jgi:hypothetical protein
MDGRAQEIRELAARLSLVAEAELQVAQAVRDPGRLKFARAAQTGAEELVLRLLQALATANRPRLY